MEELKSVHKLITRVIHDRLQKNLSLGPSWFIKLLFLLHSGFKSWVVAYNFYSNFEAALSCPNMLSNVAYTETGYRTGVLAIKKPSLIIDGNTYSLSTFLRKTHLRFHFFCRFGRQESKYEGGLEARRTPPVVDLILTASEYPLFCDNSRLDGRLRQGRTSLEMDRTLQQISSF